MRNHGVQLAGKPSLIVDESVEKKATENRIDIALFVSFFRRDQWDAA